MKPHELAAGRLRLRAFVEPILPLFGRAERRQWATVYLRGLLLNGERKTAAGIARRLDSNEQALQQFLNQSPWAWEPIRQHLALEMVRRLGPGGGWVLDDTGFPKKGQHSVGVARQYSGTLGKVGNCQLGVSLNYATSEACIPLNFQLYLPRSWTQDRARCDRAGVPPDRGFHTKGELGLEMIDQAVAWGLTPGVVVADAGYGVATSFRAALRARELTYVLGVQRETTFWLEEIRVEPPAYQGRGRPRRRHYDLPRPISALTVARELPATAWQTVSWREGTRGTLQSRFAALRAQPAHGHAQGQVLEPLGWLLIEWPETAEEPTHYWVSNLSPETPLWELIYWAKLRWWVEQNYQQLKDQLGLDHFEGRSWTGWHHHVTLTMLAFDFLVLETLRAKKNFWVDPPTGATGDTEPDHCA